MKRLWIAAVLAVCLVVIIGGGMLSVKKYSADMLKRMDALEQLAKQQKTEQCIAACRELEQKWVKAEKSLNMFLNHSELCEIGLSISKLLPMIENDEPAEFFAELCSARVQLTHISKAETVGVE